MDLRAPLGGTAMGDVQAIPHSALPPAGRAAVAGQPLASRLRLENEKPRAPARAVGVARVGQRDLGHALGGFGVAKEQDLAFHRADDRAQPAFGIARAAITGR